MQDEPTAVLDACVLVQAPLRDTLLRLAEPPSLYQPRWSEEIISEMKRTLENRIGLAADKTGLSAFIGVHRRPTWLCGPYEESQTKLAADERR